MSRIPLAPADTTEPIAAKIFEVFAAEGRPPIHLYRAFANNPEMLRAYAGLAQGLRYDATSDRGLRELLILRTAQLTGSRYEWAQHRMMALNAGVTPAQIDALAEWRDSELFDDRERAVIELAEGMGAMDTSAELFQRLRDLLGDSETIEMVLIGALYQGLARAIQAMDLEVEAEYEEYLAGAPELR
ncbi:MAG TPA: carboxymuconolactone decarboxylase family protein [Baekduia sp.]|nr:carboxymuconolactone decarboxylase family protein [Baekduia sp.]